MAPQQRALKLPKVLVDQIGGEKALSGGSKSRPQAGSRKELRKARRIEKKASRGGPPPVKRANVYHEEGHDSNGKAPAVSKSPPAKQLRDKPTKESEPRSILKRTKKADPTRKGSRMRISVSSPPRISKAVQDKLAREDEEIAALEKKLGLKGRKGLPQSFKDDGLDMLLEGLGGSEEGDEGVQQKRKRKAEGDDWLQRKRTKARDAAKGTVTLLDDDEDDMDLADRDSEGSEEADESNGDDGASHTSLDEPKIPDDNSEDDEVDLKENILNLDDDFDEFESNSESEAEVTIEHPERLKKVRENPYVAPTSGTNAATEKYIPPSLRKPASSDSEELIRLRRRTQGLVNRLTEANLIPILADIEKIYRENPRQHVTSTLVEVLLISVCEPTSLPDTLIILPAGFIASIYKIIGTDFGAQIVQRIVELFDEHYARATALGNTGPSAATVDSSKETSNLIMLLSEMYNFQVVGSNLMFDYIKMFLEKLSELNAELLLKIIRASGPQLRQDDPSSIKAIVAMLRPAIEGAGGEGNISVRTKFMIETINDLKNNRMKTGGAASAITSEHTIRMKKILGSLNTRTIKGSEPLRIGLKDIQESDKRGKWWLVGASWSGSVAEDFTEPPPSETGNKRAPAEDTGTSDLVQLAREQRMNTDIRRAIFLTIMSATDYQDAHLRLMKLKLKKVQEFEIPKVLIHCAGGEKTYNPYYTLIAKKICGDRRLKTSFQYCLWDLFKKMGESEEDNVDPDDEGDALETRQIVNLAKMFGALLVDGGLSLSSLKNLNFSYLQSKTKIFMEVFFITVLLQCQRQAENKRDEQALKSIFVQAKETPQLVRGLQYFLKKVVSKTDIAGSKEEKVTVKWACKVAGDILQAVTADTS
ncbi:suppressor of glycerol defect [Cadophora gregata]|uniref:suppressor of glycerol defect n=1 Tax=Cadophora gregata TaxID=51156 RepID=UPI0026DC11F7|nr:suppressor of glycerol defect [Cadophora gregata]KAK0101489.1 suppressor of glycerol defect [Cadophora gregata]KAK0106500.1 suppressor of glycerol defect [Cadophora gregata f. sp. sojae]